jgi:transcription initiation factor TFIIE subunit alpha
MNQAVDDTELLTEVPNILKRLALTVVKSFYETEHTAIVNLLVKHTCVKEDDLSDLLKFDKKQLRNVLARLKNDKLVKQRVYKGKQADTGLTLTFNYYFIDYKLFVNVVKYKLDHIRNKIEHDEREATNRPSFVCTQCDKRYSDLEIDRLLDPSSGELICEFCSGPIDEDTTDVELKQNSRSLLALFNEQMEQIFMLLRGCENIKLAPEILEPGPELCMKQIVPRASSSSGSTKEGWSTTKGLVKENLYEHDIKINMGDEKVSEETRKAKETPLWISQSTVGSSAESGGHPSTSTENVAPTEKVPTANHEIMKDLLAHESKKPKLDNKSTPQESSDESDNEFSNVADTSQPGKETQGESDDEDITVKIGDKNIALDDITDEMIDKMTPEEHEAYMKAYQEAFSHLY